MLRPSPLRVSLLVFALGAAAARFSPNAPESLEVGGFAFTLETVVPVEPERAFELFTADVAQWWDHCFSGEPANLSMDARPGGTFYESLGEDGGVIHAELTFVKRGERLVMRGPFGFHGRALDMVCTLDFEATEEASTLVRASVRAAGEMEAGWSAAVEGVWEHFLLERFLPYVRGKAE